MEMDYTEKWITAQWFTFENIFQCKLCVIPFFFFIIWQQINSSLPFAYTSVHRVIVSGGQSSTITVVPNHGQGLTI